MGSTAPSRPKQIEVSLFLYSGRENDREANDKDRCSGPKKKIVHLPFPRFLPHHTCDKS